MIMPGRARLPRRFAGGQVVVEMLLILPVFFLMLFCIMEMGNIAFQTILVNHCAYELARIGSLVAGPQQGGGSTSNIGTARTQMQAVLTSQMFKTTAGMATLSATSETTLYDPQSQHMNEDIIVTLTYKARLLFPGSSYLLASKNMNGYRKITAQVRMPIEKPDFQ
jgi:Flp pilus assembly protein TadG